jgi:hypothetical protein
MSYLNVLQNYLFLTSRTLYKVQTPLKGKNYWTFVTENMSITMYKDSIFKPIRITSLANYFKFTTVYIIISSPLDAKLIHL